MKVGVVYGDITTDFPVNAIATLINSWEWWFSGVDNSIRRVAGNQFHMQAQRVLENAGLEDGQVIIAEKIYPHSGSFNDIIFVVDDFKNPLSHLVYRTLHAARERSYKTIALPVMRSGVAMGIMGKSMLELTQELVKGLELFNQKYPNYPIQVIIVSYHDLDAKEYIETLLTHTGFT